LFEPFREWFFVEENVWVAEPAIELFLEFGHALLDTVQIAVACCIYENPQSTFRRTRGASERRTQNYDHSIQLPRRSDVSYRRRRWHRRLRWHVHTGRRLVRWFDPHHFLRRHTRLFDGWNQRQDAPISHTRQGVKIVEANLGEIGTGVRQCSMLNAPGRPIRGRRSGSW
jgi:hypothetical protein